MAVGCTRRLHVATTMAPGVAKTLGAAQEVMFVMGFMCYENLVKSGRGQTRQAGCGKDPISHQGKRRTQEV